MAQSKKVITINSAKDMDKLMNGSLKILPGNKKVILNLKGMPEKENEIWTEKIEAVYNECGCKKGENFTYGGTTLAVLYIAVCFIVFEEILPRDYVITIALIVGAAILGKTIGLLERRKKLINCIQKIRREYNLDS